MGRTGIQRDSGSAGCACPARLGLALGEEKTQTDPTRALAEAMAALEAERSLGARAATPKAVRASAVPAVVVRACRDRANCEHSAAKMLASGSEPGQKT